MAGSRVRITLDLRAPGKARGHVLVPFSSDESAYGCLQLPITVIAGGAGPTVLLTGGVHGDEYEGPILLARLADELEPGQVAGRLLILPVLNLPALEAGQRTSPLDGLNLNRVFPGSPGGGVTELIAHFVAERLLPECDVLVDLHSGGRSLLYSPLAATHLLDDPERDRRALAALRAFGAPYALLARDIDSHGLLDHTAEAMGKLVISTELGGGGIVSPRALRVGAHGVRRLLRHLGVLGDQLAPQPEGASRLIQIADLDAFALAPASGIYEPRLELEEMVAAGDTLGLVHPPGVERGAAAAGAGLAGGDSGHIGADDRPCLRPQARERSAGWQGPDERRGLEVGCGPALARARPRTDNGGTRTVISNTARGRGARRHDHGAC